MSATRTIYLSVRLDDGEIDLLEEVAPGGYASIGGGTCARGEAGYAIDLTTILGAYSEVLDVVPQVLEVILCARLTALAEADGVGVRYTVIPD